MMRRRKGRDLLKKRTDGRMTLCADFGNRFVLSVLF